MDAVAAAEQECRLGRKDDCVRSLTPSVSEDPQCSYCHGRITILCCDRFCDAVVVTDQKFKHRSIYFLVDRTENDTVLEKEIRPICCANYDSKVLRLDPMRYS